MRIVDLRTPRRGPPNRPPTTTRGDGQLQYDEFMAIDPVYGFIVSLAFVVFIVIGLMNFTIASALLFLPPGAQATIHLSNASAPFLAVLSNAFDQSVDESKEEMARKRDLKQSLRESFQS